MSAILVAVMCIAAFVLAYSFYARYIQNRILGLDPGRKTPAHEKYDGIDYVPSHRMVLFGHHFASIAGLGPIVGPAIAAIWGWLPALLWVVFGTIFLGAVHDFVAAGISVRFGGRSIGDVTGDIMGPRARILFLLIISFVVGLFMGAFAIIVGGLLFKIPESVIPVFGLIVIAVGMGLMLYRMKVQLWVVTILGIVLMGLAIYVGTIIPVSGIPQTTWIPILLGYSLVASVLPVWLLLQPRDYLNSFQLYGGLGILFIGLLVAAPLMQAPETSNVLGDGQSIPSVFPIMFMIVACAAISGFHSLVSSGTTVRQVNSEKDLRFVTYGSMLTEGFFGVMVLLTCTAGIAFSRWQELYADYKAVVANPLPIFLEGGSGFLGQLGINPKLGALLLTVMAVGFAMTTLDTATRLLRFNIEELSGRLGLKRIGKNRYLASAIAIVWIGFFVLITAAGRTEGGVIKASDNPLWPIAGMSNQLMAALGLLTASVYFYKVKKPTAFTLLPMLIMLGLTLWAIAEAVGAQISPPPGTEMNYGVLFVALALFGLAVWLMVEGVLKAAQLRRERKTKEVTTGE
ncbi:MAG: carbon starvation protein A [Planctomycetota bacterium]